MPRLFTAIDLDHCTRAELERALRPVREQAPAQLRWLAPESWHFTLQFLGAVQDAAVAALGDACARAASAQAPFELELSGAGTFASARAARVVWIGVSRGAEAMAALYDALTAQTGPLGFPPEARPYSPHLTVARCKRPLRLEALLGAVELVPLAIQVSELTLFRSHLSSQGARYEALSRYPLGRG